MNKLLMGFAMMIVATLCAAADEPLSFKGLPLGAPEQELLRQYPAAKCIGDTSSRTCFLTYSDLAPFSVQRDPQREREAREIMTVAGAFVTSIMFTLYDDRLARIYLSPHPNLFETVSTAFMDRYGKPNSAVVEAVVTRAGVKYENRKMVWLRPGGQIWLNRYGSSVTSSSLAYVSEEGLARALERQEEQRKNAAQQL